MHIQDLAGVAHDDIDLSMFSISGDEQIVSSCTLQNSLFKYYRPSIVNYSYSLN